MKSVSESQFLNGLATPQILQTPLLSGPFASSIRQWCACWSLAVAPAESEELTPVAWLEFLTGPPR